MKPTIRFVEIAYFPQDNSIRYTVSKQRPSNRTLTGIEKYFLTYTDKTVPQTIINYVKNAKHSLDWDMKTTHKECAVSNDKTELEHLIDVYSAIEYMSNFRINER